MKKKLIVFITLILIILAISNQINATISGIDTEKFKPGIEEGLANYLGDVIGIIQIVGVAVAAIACIVMGIRYILSSTEDRADIKKKLIPFVIGPIIFVGATGVLRLISSIASWFGTNN